MRSSMGRTLELGEDRQKTLVIKKLCKYVTGNEAIIKKLQQQANYK
jgi:hypothetical protein